ncbi:MAG: hypothetical protein ACP5OG_03810 [Candidatus Nanoarchaeia archaeon]
MSEIKLPKLLTLINEDNFKTFKTSRAGGAVFIFGKDSSSSHLEVFRTPLKLDYACELGMGKGMAIYKFANKGKNIGWSIKKYQKRNNDLWGSFSEESIMEKINDKENIIYEIKCMQVSCIDFFSKNFGKENVYFLEKGEQEDEIKEVFDFSAKKLTFGLDSRGFDKKQMDKLSYFLYEDFSTMKYSKKSRKIGQEADACFF